MISMISSVGKNMEIGKDNKLIWRIPEDMKFFKNTTMGHIVIMGWKTFQSLPGPLSGRKMIVISRNNSSNDVEIIRDPQQIVDKYVADDDEVFVIGGASLYNKFFEYSTNLYLTEINDTRDDADTFFPRFDKSEWNDILLIESEYKNIKYKVHKYVRK